MPVRHRAHVSRNPSMRVLPAFLPVFLFDFYAHFSLVLFVVVVPWTPSPLPRGVHRASGTEVRPARVGPLEIFCDHIFFQIKLYGIVPSLRGSTGVDASAVGVHEPLLFHEEQKSWEKLGKNSVKLGCLVDRCWFFFRRCVCSMRKASDVLFSAQSHWWNDGIDHWTVQC